MISHLSPSRKGAKTQRWKDEKNERGKEIRDAAIAVYTCNELVFGFSQYILPAIWLDFGEALITRIASFKISIGSDGIPNRFVYIRNVAQV